MDSLLIVNLVLEILILIVFITYFIFYRKNIKKSKDVDIELLQETLSNISDGIEREAKATRDNTTNILNLQSNNIQNNLTLYRENMDANIKASEERIANINKNVSENLNEIRSEAKFALKEIKTSNDVQLEKIREAVDEKLSATIEKRFQDSFKIVSERIDAITKGFGEMQNLTAGMDDLKRVLTNVKSRGTWGEASLDSMLSQVLAPEQYDKNVKITKSINDDMVDFVINLPGKSSQKVMLPIDSKFPIEDYQRILEATDDKEYKEARHALEVHIRKEAISIKNKYIRVPKTTDFAIMYLPIEGLFNEAISIRGLCDELQNNQRVILCGPTTLAALLNSLQMGFKSVAIEKRTSEIYKLLNAFKRDFEKFCELLAKTQKKLRDVSSSIDKASDRTRIIQNKLDKVELLGYDDSTQALDKANEG